MGDRQHIGDFARERGEVVRRGDADVLGLGRPLPANIPIGVSPPLPLQVHSVFDARPIGAFDFAIDATGNIGNGEVTLLTLTVPVPDGYTAVLRRIALEFQVPGVINAVFNAADDRRLELRPQRDGYAVPDSAFIWRTTIEDRVLPIFHPYGFWQSMGLTLFRVGAFVTASTIRVGASFQGTLIPSRSLDPTLEVASDPTNVRILRDRDPLRPEVGAAHGNGGGQ